MEGGTHVDLRVGAELHDGAAKGAERVLDVDGESQTLAQEELAGEDVFGILSAKGLTESGG